MVGMRNVQNTFKTRKRSIISALSICTTVPLKSPAHLVGEIQT